MVSRPDVEPVQIKDRTLYTLTGSSLKTAFSYREKPLIAFHGTDRELDRLSVRSQGLHFAAPLSQALNAVMHCNAAIRCPHTPFYDGANVFVAVLELKNPLVMHDPWQWNCPVRILSSLPTRFEPLNEKRRRLFMVDPPDYHDLKALKTEADDFGFETKVFGRKSFAGWKNDILPEDWEPCEYPAEKNEGLMAAFYHALQKRGFDSVVYRNLVEGTVGWSALVFDDDAFQYYYPRSLTR